MTGTATNASGGSLFTGMAVAEDESGNLIAASPQTPAIGLVTSAAAVGQIASFADEGIISKSDWSQVTGSKSITRGTVYYVGQNGMLSTSGSQQAGIARSATDLRVQLSATLPPMPPTVHQYQLNTVPSNAMGNPGDFAVNIQTGAIYTKSSAGWSSPMFLGQAPRGVVYPPFIFHS